MSIQKLLYASRVLTSLLIVSSVFFIALVSRPLNAELPENARIISQSGNSKNRGGLRSGKMVTIGKAVPLGSKQYKLKPSGLENLSNATVSVMANHKRQDIRRKKLAVAERKLFQQQVEAMYKSGGSHARRQNVSPNHSAFISDNLPNGLIQTGSGTYMPKTGHGYTDPRNGTFYHDVGAGVVNTRTGQFSIKH